MNKVYLHVLLSTFILTQLGCHHNVVCSYPITIAVGDLEKETKLSLWVDKLGKRGFISPFYHVSSNKKDILVEDYCNGKNSIEIKFQTNNKDTIIFVNPRIVSKIYIGNNSQNEYKVFLVEFAYRDSFQGKRINEIIFED